MKGTGFGRIDLVMAALKISSRNLFGIPEGSDRIS
jgi:hypothetical protein